MIKAAAREQLPVSHPENPDIHDITIAQLSGEPVHPSSSRRNTVIVSTGTLDWSRPHSWTGALDRSPCGTGTCAKMATLHAKGKLPLGQDFVHEGILGTTFTGRLIEETQVGKLPRGGSHSLRASMDHRLRTVRGRSGRSVSKRVYRWRYLEFFNSSRTVLPSVKASSELAVPQHSCNPVLHRACPIGTKSFCISALDVVFDPANLGALPSSRSQVRRSRSPS